MWSLRGEERLSNSSSRTSSPMSKSSSPSSQSQSPFSAPSSGFQNPRAKTMEEVWKGINGPPEGQHCTRQARGRASPQPNNGFHHRNTFTGTNIQEFLARPFNREPPSSLSTAMDFCGFGGPARPLPPISLCLNTLPELQNSVDTPPANHSNDASGAPFGLSSPFDAFGSCSAFPGFNKKRGSESEDNTGDRRHKRMIKNRESAARSRARKQSYTNELEFQVDYLTKENERLLKQQQQLCLAAAAQVPQKRTLHRTSTAPF